jgi:hypothetical protein
VSYLRVLRDAYILSPPLFTASAEMLYILANGLQQNKMAGKKTHIFHHSILIFF